MARRRRKPSESSTDEPQSRKIESPGRAWDSTIIEQIDIPGCSSNFAIHEKMSDDSWWTRCDLQFPDPHGRGILVPMKKTLWPLSGRPVEYASDEQLFKENLQFLDYHLEVRDKRCYTVMGSYVFLTWRIEEFDVVPYLHFLGPPNTGKTKALELLELLCYRGWRITHPTVAVVFFVVNLYSPTLLADNYEFWPKETRNELDGLFNAGYRKGGVVPRRPRSGEFGPELLIYEVFCPKALAGTRLPVESLASRCIIIRMTRSQREIPIRIDMKWAQELRSKLLWYRFQHFQRRKT